MSNYTYRIDMDLDLMTFEVHLGVNDVTIRIYNFKIPHPSEVLALAAGTKEMTIQHHRKTLTIPKALFAFLDAQIMKVAAANAA
jgi:ubiquinone/menaquinone biosynthesis C-methylase UbiE